MSVKIKGPPEGSEFLTLGEVAERYSITAGMVRNAIYRGEIKAIKFGWVWLIRMTSLPEKWKTKPRRT